MSDNPNSDDDEKRTHADENADGAVDNTYEARVGDEQVSMDTSTPTVKQLLEAANKETNGVYLSTPDGTDFTDLNAEVDLSQPGRERFLVQTRTSGNAV